MDRRSALGMVLVAMVSGCTTDPAPGPTSSGASVPTAADYTWFTEDEDNVLVNGFSLTWVQGVKPAEVVTRLGGATLWESDWDHLYTENHPENSVAITEVASWSMIMDFAGFGIDEAPLLTLSRGTTVVYQFLNVELDGIYRLVKDGTVHVEFAPYEPSSREGSAPDELLEAMTAVGFDPNPSSDGGNGDDDDRADETETAFALTEHLTGIRLSPAFLEAQSYLLATRPAA